ncbi:GNAT family N-acetyltransferase, partial [Bacteroidota bacterium]
MIDTKRLTARKITMNDKETWLEFLQGDDRPEFISFAGPTLEDSKKWIERQLNRYKKDGYGLMALIKKETGDMVGHCGILIQEVEGIKETEVGYHIIPRFRNQGYATEAAMAFRDYIFEHDLSESVISLIHVDNMKSQRVAEKNGMKRDFITKRFGYM